MKIKFIPTIFALAMALSNSVIASQIDTTTSINEEQKNIIQQYVLDLAKADYKDISSLFTKDGSVVSTSRGNVNAKDFFYAFLPNIESASTDAPSTLYKQ